MTGGHAITPRAARFAVTAFCCLLISVLTGALPAPAGAEAVRAAPLLAADPILPAEACAQVIVYVVRGSGEKPQSGPGIKRYDPATPTVGYAETWEAFDPTDPDTGGSSIDAGIALDLREDGTPTVATENPYLYDLVQKVHERVGGQLSLSWTPIRYRALPIEFSAEMVLHGYPSSVATGVHELHRTLKRQWELCGTHTRYVLAGYSQGADVVTSYLRGKIVAGSVDDTFRLVEYVGPNKDIAGQIAAVTLIADPNHDPADPESYSNIDDAMASKGGFFGISAGIPEPAASVTDSICLAGDLVCGQGVDLSTFKRGLDIHVDGYRNFIDHPVACEVGGESEPESVSAITCMADRIVERLGVRNLILDPLDDADSAPGTTGRDVAFFIDTTGSMSDDIDAAIEFAGNQADRIISLDGRVALVQYRDHDDDVPAEVVVGFTADMDEFRLGLESLDADGGGDEPEGLLHALMVGFDELEWQFGASKAAVILTDASFHEPDRGGGETLPQVERRSLQIDPVNVFPVVYEVGDYGDLAARTSGEVIINGAGDTEAALTEALDNIAERPTAVLNNQAYTAVAGRDVHFDASRSAAAEGDIAEYRWDFDGDGFSDETTVSPHVSHEYPAGHFGVMQVLVVDDAGRSSNASARVLVAEEPQRGVVRRVPTARGMKATGERASGRVDLTVEWTAGSGEPDRWVVAVDGDPVGSVGPEEDTLTVPVGFQADPWEVTLTPMDADGNLGPRYAAQLAPIPAPDPWHTRPLVWGSGAAAGLGGALLVWWATRRRVRPGARSAPSRGGA